MTARIAGVRVSGRLVLRALAATVAVVVVASCSSFAGSSSPDPALAPPDTIAKIKQAGRIKVGVKFDQPGLSLLAKGASTPQGFDDEIAKIIVARLGLTPDKIQWVETVSKNREKFLLNGTVDIVVASYSITDGRRILVGQAGPYMVTGQQILVRKDDAVRGPQDLLDKKVCTATGSTSIQNLEEDFGIKAQPLATYSDCVNELLAHKTDAVSTDGPILLGFAAQHPNQLEVVGDTFTEERYGIGFPKGDTAFCQLISNALSDSFTSGAWGEAFDSTLGRSGTPTPQPPSLDPCV